MARAGSGSVVSLDGGATSRSSSASAKPSAAAGAKRRPEAATARARGIAHQPAGRCPRCEIEAMAAGAGRTVRQIIRAALYGSAIPGTGPAAGRSAQAEAGS